MAQNLAVAKVKAKVVATQEKKMDIDEKIPFV